MRQHGQKPYQIIFDYSKQLIYDGTMNAPSDSRTRSDLGRANRRAVLGEIAINGTVTRTALAAHTGLTGASVSRITRELIDAGLVIEHQPEGEATGPGRRFVDLTLNPRGGYVLGIGLNLFQQSVTLADLHNRLVHRVDLGLPSVHDPEVVIGRLTEVAKDVIGSIGGGRTRLLGGSIAITGAADPSRGVVRESPILHWRDVDIGGRLAKALGLPMLVESLPNAIVTAETRFGVARGCRNVMLFNCALGIGAGLYIDGTVLRGRNFTAGVIANVPAIDSDGMGLTLDETASGFGVLRRLGISPGPDGKRLAGNEEAAKLLQVLQAGDEGEARYTAAIAAAGHTLGMAIRQFAGLISPEQVVLSGPMAQSAAYVAAVEEARTGGRGSDIAQLPIKVSALSPQAAARWLAIGEFLVNRDLDLDALRLKEAS